MISGLSFMDQNVNPFRPTVNTAESHRVIFKVLFNSVLFVNKLGCNRDDFSDSW